MKVTEIITYHGWGFDSRIWQALETGSSGQAEWHHFDRGYFGEDRKPAFSGRDVDKVVITHSFGLHMCPDSVMAEADLLVVFSGFLSFHPAAAQFRRRSKQVVSEMISQFESDPEKVLNVFYRNVFHPQKVYDLPDSPMDADLLLKDLRLLDEQERAMPPVSEQARVLIFHGSDDAIVPKGKGRTLYEQFGEQARYFEIRQAGHALPVTEASRCWQLIEPHLAGQPVNS